EATAPDRADHPSPPAPLAPSSPPLAGSPAATPRSPPSSARSPSPHPHTRSAPPGKRRGRNRKDAKSRSIGDEKTKSFASLRLFGLFCRASFSLRGGGGVGSVGGVDEGGHRQGGLGADFEAGLLEGRIELAVQATQRVAHLGRPLVVDAELGRLLPAVLVGVEAPLFHRYGELFDLRLVVRLLVFRLHLGRRRRIA